jgi:hypothetical protein
MEKKDSKRGTIKLIPLSEFLTEINSLDLVPFIEQEI